jgi:hypothetical protein
LSNVIKLTVPADRKAGRVDAREFSLGELEELQSKLILVAGEAGKGKASVERFSMVSSLKAQKCKRELNCVNAD